MKKLAAGISVIIIIGLCIQERLHAQFDLEKIQVISLFGVSDAAFQYHPDIRYNRVEGLFLGAGVRYTPEALYDITFHTNAGYGLSSEE